MDLIIDVVNSARPEVKVKDIPCGHVFRIVESGAVGFVCSEDYYIFLKWADGYEDIDLHRSTCIKLRKDNNFIAVDLGSLKFINKITVE